MVDLGVTMGGLSGNVEKDVRQLNDYVWQLTEHLQYLLENLSVTNFNDLGLARYENGRMQIYTEALDVKVREINASIENLDKGLSVRIEANERGISSVVQDLGTLSGTVGGMTSAINQNADRIALVVSDANTIKAASIVTAINDAGSSVKIKADNIDLTGYVTVKSLGEAGSVEIDGGNIKANTLVVESSGIIDNYDTSVKISDGGVQFDGTYICSADRDAMVIDAHFLDIYSFGRTRIFTGGSTYWAIDAGGISFTDRNGDTRYVVLQ